MLLAVIAVQLGACAKSAQLPVSAGTGPNPTLPAPDKALIPTVKVAKAVGWAAGATPVSAPGTRVTLLDRKSTRLNSSHSQISYAVFCLKKKKTKDYNECNALDES